MCPFLVQIEEIFLSLRSFLPIAKISEFDLVRCSFMQALLTPSCFLNSFLDSSILSLAILRKSGFLGFLGILAVSSLDLQHSTIAFTVGTDRI